MADDTPVKVPTLSARDTEILVAALQSPKNGGQLSIEVSCNSLSIMPVN
jgi:hypothetical protein